MSHEWSRWRLEGRQALVLPVHFDPMLLEQGRPIISSRTSNMPERIKSYLYYMGSCLDLFGVSSGSLGAQLLPDPSENGFRTDALSLIGDWYAVGRELRSAMISEGHVEKEKQGPSE